MMNFRYMKVLGMVLLVALCATTALFAQTSTTGAIVGTITDNTGAPLPGVTVEVRSPQLQGVNNTVTDAKGIFRFSLIPPGAYTLNATLSGFSPVRQTNVEVGVNRTVTLEIKMNQAVSEQITVTAAAPVVDITSTTSGANVTSQTMASLPLARNFVAAVQLAPGTSNDAVGPTVYGSSGAENQYIIDGLNTTGVRSGDNQKQLNMDFVQEVQVQTGGMPAEYGRLTGGVINAITKSGGNTWTGEVFSFDSPKSFQAGNTTFGQRSITAASAIERNKQIVDGGFNTGGYFVKDRVWFFGAYDYQNRTDLSTKINTPINVPGFSLPIGGALSTKVKNNLFAGKLTLRATENQNFTLSAFGDPTKTDGPLFAIAGPPSTFAGTLSTGGTDVNGRYSGVFGTSFLADASVGRHEEKSIIGGAGTSIAQQIDATVSPNTNSGGFGFFSNEKYTRTVEKADVSKFLGTHEFKLGGDYEDLKGHLENFQGGAGQRIYKFQTASGITYYRHRYYINDLAPGFKQSDSSTFQMIVPEVTEPQTKNTSAYLQDSWKLRSNLTINAGVRWEDQKVLGRTGLAFEINNNYAPRLGIIWDVANNGRSKAYANFGRFFESIPMDINIRAFGGEVVCFCYNFSPDPSQIKGDPTAPKRTAALGSPTEPVDPNLKGQHIDEYLAGYDYEISPAFAVGIKGTYRKLANVIEDMLIGTTGEYLIANPGSGIGAEAGFYEGGTVATPRPTRTYKGVELHAEKHFSNHTQFFASYVWSKMEGNYDGTFQSSTGQLDPNINSAFDYADFIVNNKGVLSGDRTHQLKFYGSYLFDKGAINGLSIGVAAHYFSGTPLTAMGYSFAYSNWEYYLTPRGALGRNPADYEADLQASFPIQTGATKITLVADVFNALNLQRKIALDNRFNTNEAAQQCVGFINPAASCTSDGGLKTVPGTVNPVGAVDPSKAPNPTFLKAGTAFSGPRTFRLGVRVSF